MQSSYDPNTAVAQQQSPFQAALERAVLAEMRQPRGVWMPQISEMRRMQAEPRLNHLGMPDITQPERLTYAEPSQFGHMLQAGVQQSNALNDMQGQRLGALLAGSGQQAAAAAQMAQAQAQTSQAQTEARKQAWLESPAGQKFAATLAGIHGGSVTPTTSPGVFGGTPNPAVVVGETLGKAPGMPLPETFDEAVKQHIAGGGQPITPGSPEHQAWQRQYGEDMMTRMDNKAISRGERLYGMLPPIGMASGLLRMMGLDPAKKAAAAHRVFSGVGVPIKESAAQPGVLSRGAPVRSAPAILSREERDAERAKAANKFNSIAIPEGKF